MTATPVDLEQALRDPAAVFATPEDVAAHPGLTREQKIEILRLWEYDAAEAEVATEEGMPGGDGDLLRRVLLALEGLGAGSCADETGPTKQHAVLARRTERDSGASTYTRILAAVDGSAQGEHALRHAAGLARAFGAALRIVHVVDMGVLPLAPELALDVEWLAKARRAEGEKLLAAARERARADGVTAEARLVETATPTQRPAGVLLEEAAAWPADVVVLGTRGRGSLERLLLGSVADGMARRSPVPVVLVP
ncbi:MAG: universal stress protein [Burkholderiales bacterium]|nr:universal stress protein [Burkholderiales bacterium]